MLFVRIFGESDSVFTKNHYYNFGVYAMINYEFKCKIVEYNNLQ